MNLIIDAIKRGLFKTSVFNYLCDKNNRIIYSINGLSQNSNRLEILYDDWEQDFMISIKLYINSMCIYQHRYIHTNISDFSRPLNLLMEEYEISVKSYIRDNKITDILDESN